MTFRRNYIQFTPIIRPGHNDVKVKAWATLYNYRKTGLTLAELAERGKLSYKSLSVMLRRWISRGYVWARGKYSKTYFLKAKGVRYLAKWTTFFDNLEYN